MGERRLAAFFRFMRTYGSFFSDASAVVVACTVRYDAGRFGLDEQALEGKVEALGTLKLRHMLDHTVEKSVAMAVQNLLLKAYELGYGGCVMDAPLIIEEELRRMLDIPSDYQVVTVIPLGVPAHEPSPPQRRPVGEVLRYI